jgi:hypothetical protein
MRGPIIGGVLLLLVAGCKHVRSGISAPSMNARREANLLSTAAARLNCPRADLTTTFIQSVEPNQHLYQVVGCNRAFVSLLHCVAACTWRELPEGSAANALGCPLEELTRTYAGHGDFTYKGCGKALTYVYQGTDWVAQPVAASP